MKKMAILSFIVVLLCVPAFVFSMYLLDQSSYNNNNNNNIETASSGSEQGEFVDDVDMGEKQEQPATVMSWSEVQEINAKKWWMWEFGGSEQGWEVERVRRQQERKRQEQERRDEEERLRKDEYERQQLVLEEQRRDMTIECGLFYSDKIPNEYYLVPPEKMHVPMSQPLKRLHEQSFRRMQVMAQEEFQEWINRQVEAGRVFRYYY